MDSNEPNELTNKIEIESQSENRLTVAGEVWVVEELSKRKKTLRCGQQCGDYGKKVRGATGDRKRLEGGEHTMQ